MSNGDAWAEYQGQALRLSARQRMFLQLLAQGHTARGVAIETRYSWAYVYAQMRVAREVLGAQTNTAAVVAGLRAGIISMPSPDEMVMSG